MQPLRPPFTSKPTFDATFNKALDVVLRMAPESWPPDFRHADATHVAEIVFMAEWYTPGTILRTFKSLQAKDVDEAIRILQEAVNTLRHMDPSIAENKRPPADELAGLLSRNTGVKRPTHSTRLTGNTIAIAPRAGTLPR